MEVPAIDNVPPETLSVSPVTERLLTDALPVSVTWIFPGWLMTTAEVELGTTPVLQSDAVLHDPLLSTFHMSVLSSRRLSKASMA